MSVEDPDSRLQLHRLTYLLCVFCITFDIIIVGSSVGIFAHSMNIQLNEFLIGHLVIFIFKEKFLEKSKIT